MGDSINCSPAFSVVVCIQDLGLKGQLPILVFAGVCNDIVRFNDNSVPGEPSHLLHHLKAQGMWEFIESSVARQIGARVPTLPGQLSHSLSLYSTRFSFARGRGYVEQPEFGVQSGNKHTPGHIDRGKNLPVILPCAEHSITV